MTLARISSHDIDPFTEEVIEDHAVVVRFDRIVEYLKAYGEHEPPERTAAELAEEIETEINDARERCKRKLQLVPYVEIEIVPETETGEPDTEDHAVAECVHEIVENLRAVDESCGLPPKSIELAEEMEVYVQAARDEFREHHQT